MGEAERVAATITGDEAAKAMEAVAKGKPASTEGGAVEPGQERPDWGDVKVVGCRGTPEIPERTIRKLARNAGLPYIEKAPDGGGGLCRGIEGIKGRRRAMMVLGELVGRIGAGSTDRAIETSGACWLDVMGWREDAEYSRLWDEALRTRKEVAAARLFDLVVDRCANGFEVEEAKSTKDGMVRVKVRKFDNGNGMQLLKAMGYVGKDAAKGGVGGKGSSGKAGGEGGEPGAGVAPAAPDTVLFADRKTAFEVMGMPAGTAGAPSNGDASHTAGGPAI